MCCTPHQGVHISQTKNLPQGYAKVVQVIEPPSFFDLSGPLFCT